MSENIEASEIQRDSGSEGQEGTRTDRSDSIELEQATIEPEASVEQSGDYTEAEAIEAGIAEVVDTATQSRDEEVSTLSIPTPGEADEVAGSDLGTGDERVSDISLPIPDPAMERESEISDIPTPSPDSVVEGIPDLEIDVARFDDDAMNEILRIEELLPEAANHKTQEAMRTFQERVFSSTEPIDYYAVASEAVQDQFEEIAQPESDGLVAVLLERTSRVIQAELGETSEEGREPREVIRAPDDVQLAKIDLQDMLQKQQKTLQMLSNISKMLHDTAMAVIRNIK